jgi:hypothetical protein
MLFRNRLGERDDAPRNQAPATLILAREQENHVTCRDMLAAIHRLLRCQREGLRPWIGNLCLERKYHAAVCHASSMDLSKAMLSPLPSGPGRGLHEARIACLSSAMRNQVPLHAIVHRRRPTERRDAPLFPSGDSPH